MNTEKIATLRREYTQRGLSEHDIAPDPIEQFGRWLDDAIHAHIVEPNAMTVATVASDGQPSVRAVLLKDYGPTGFTFYTNYDSAKSRDLRNNPRTALHFLWTPLERQVRVEGVAEKLPDAEAEKYFNSRPFESQVGAWVSAQSHVIPNRAFLEEKFREMMKSYHGRTVFAPPYWCGYRVVPQRIEFWQGRPHRLHDRIRYRHESSVWVIERLAP